MRLRLCVLGLELIDLEISTDSTPEEDSDPFAGIPLPALLPGLPPGVRFLPPGVTCTDPDCTTCVPSKAPSAPPAAPSGPSTPAEPPKRVRVGFIQ